MAQYQHGQVCERKFGEPKCPLHPNNDVVLFCEECSNLLCLNCITSTDHKGHSFHNLEDMVKKNYNGLFRFIYNVNQSFQPKIKEKISYIDKMKNDFKKRKTSILREISIEYEKCVEQLKTQKQAMEAEVNTLYDGNCKHRDLLKNKMEALNQKLESNSKELQHLFDEGSLVEKFDAWKSISLKEKEANSELDKPGLDTFEFVIDQHKVNELMEKALGEIKVYKNIKVANRQSNVIVTRPHKHTQSISAATSFANDLERFRDITPIAENRSWCKTNGVELYLINKEGTIQRKLPLKSSYIKCICLQPVSGVLYGTFRDKTICTIDTTTGGTSTVLSCSYTPGCITLTLDGNIVVGELWSSPGHLYRYAFNGQLLHQSKEKYKVFDISYSDMNDHVAIACNRNGLTIMDGTLTNVIYTHELICFTIAYDKDGSLVVCDFVNNSIHILDGQTFSTIRTFTHPQMSSPRQIRLYDNFMWVQCLNPDKIVHIMLQ